MSTGSGIFTGVGAELGDPGPDPGPELGLLRGDWGPLPGVRWTELSLELALE